MRYSLGMCLDINEKLKLFYYSVCFLASIHKPLYLLVLFMNLVVLFQLTFTFISSTFNNKFSISVK